MSDVAKCAWCQQPPTPLTQAPDFVRCANLECPGSWPGVILEDWNIQQARIAEARRKDVAAGIRICHQTSMHDIFPGSTRVVTITDLAVQNQAIDDYIRGAQ